MTPETSAYIVLAHRHIGHARHNLTPDNAPVAAREAYMAGFHAAQALIFERTGKSAKTHSGVHARLHALIRDEPRFPARLRGFLSKGFTLKSNADYGLRGFATLGEATMAVEQAAAFVAAVETVLAG